MEFVPMLVSLALVVALGVVAVALWLRGQVQ
jgi:hypothetical protein